MAQRLAQMFPGALRAFLLQGNFVFIESELPPPRPSSLASLLML